MTDPTMSGESLPRGILGGIGAAVLVLLVVALLGEVLPSTRIRFAVWLGLGAGGLWCVRSGIYMFSGGAEGFRVTAIAWALTVVAAFVGTMALPYWRGDFTLGGFMSDGTDSPEGRLVFLATMQVIGATLLACFGGDD